MTERDTGQFQEDIQLIQGEDLHNAVRELFDTREDDFMEVALLFGTERMSGVDEAIVARGVDGKVIGLYTMAPYGEEFNIATEYMRQQLGDDGARLVQSLPPELREKLDIHGLEYFSSQDQ